MSDKQEHLFFAKLMEEGLSAELVPSRYRSGLFLNPKETGCGGQGNTPGDHKGTHAGTEQRHATGMEG